MAYDSALLALSDPTRRQVFETLARDGPLPVGRLADGLPVSRPAVSQHLAVLGAAGLVQARPEGARRLYSVRREGLDELRLWIEDLWGEALAAFKQDIENPTEKDAAHDRTN